MGVWLIGHNCRGPPCNVQITSTKLSCPTRVLLIVIWCMATQNQILSRFGAGFHGEILFIPWISGKQNSMNHTTNLHIQPIGSMKLIYLPTLFFHLYSLINNSQIYTVCKYTSSMDPYLIMVNLVPLYASRFSDPASGLYWATLRSTGVRIASSKVISVFFLGRVNWFWSYIIPFLCFNQAPASMRNIALQSQDYFHPIYSTIYRVLNVKNSTFIVYIQSFHPIYSPEK